MYRSGAAGNALSVAVVATALVVGACGHGAATSSRDADVAAGRIASIPRFPRSDPTGPLSTTGGVRTRSYLTFDVTPRAVVEWYQSHLQGWTPVGPLQTVGTKTVRATWERGTQRLEISAGPAPTIRHTGDGMSVQYNILIRLSV